MNLRQRSSVTGLPSLVFGFLLGRILPLRSPNRGTTTMTNDCPGFAVQEVKRFTLVRRVSIATSKAKKQGG